MPHRLSHTPSRYTLFAFALLGIGVFLPLFAALSAPSSPTIHAAGLPTARIITPSPVAQEKPVAASQPSARPPIIAASPTIVRTAVPSPIPSNQPEATLSPTALQPSPMLPTITPVQLPPVLASNAVATLMPTIGPAADPPAMLLMPTLQPGALPAVSAPILMYHYIRTVDPAIDPTGYALSITPEQFEAQMAWLYEQGYAAIRMDTLARCLQGTATCPPHAVALTFDDGYADAFLAALPVLQRYGFSATFYIISGLVGQPGYMTWEQLAALRDAGMEIGAHTIDHLNLTSLDPAEAERQIAQSRADLERGLRISIVSFCYPTGLYDAGIEEYVRAAGYLSATTTRWDFDYSDLLALPRRRVAGGTTIEEFIGIVQS